jgi:ubiquitin C-terminal hydrolase
MRCSTDSSRILSSHPAESVVIRRFVIADWGRVCHTNFSAIIRTFVSSDLSKIILFEMCFKLRF